MCYVPAALVAVVRLPSVRWKLSIVLPALPAPLRGTQNCWAADNHIFALQRIVLPGRRTHLLSHNTCAVCVCTCGQSVAKCLRSPLV